MKIKTAWALQSFLLCFLFNLALGALIFYMAGRCLEALNQWVSPLIGAGAPTLPGELHAALGGFAAFTDQAHNYLLPLLVVLTVAITLLLWFFVFLAGGRQIRRAGELSGMSSGPVAEADESGVEPT
jgi:NhaP-type Na+/H+ or K+/H+ antiporter